MKMKMMEMMEMMEMMMLKVEFVHQSLTQCPVANLYATFNWDEWFYART